MQKSQKFQFINNFNLSVKLKNYLPKRYRVVGEAQNYKKYFSNSVCYVLRSSLRSEGSVEKINAGKSLSFKEIDTYEKFKKHYLEVLQQENLEEIYLEEQFYYLDHLTIYFKDDLCFVQVNNENTNKVSFFSITQNFISNKVEYFKIFEPFYNLWLEFGRSEDVVIEAGINDQEMKIFQIIPVSSKVLKNIFTDDFIVKLVKSKERFSKKKSFLSLLKTERDAKKFRNNLKLDLKDISNSFKNWEYIFHYFYLYCVVRKKSGTDQDLVDFLNHILLNKHKWPSQGIFKHLQMANLIRKYENSTELPAMFKTTSSKLYFLGKNKQLRGKLKDIAVKVDKLTPEYIYNQKDKKLILTPNNEILGHAFLAAIESNIPIVGNMDRKYWEGLTNEDFLTVDFKTKEFIVKLT